MRYLFYIALAVLCFLLADWAIHPAAANEVKYCIDLQSGEIITVPKGMPCPGTTSEY